MTHWHIVTFNERREVLSALHYDNPARSVGDYVEMVYEIFGAMLNEEDRSIYMTNMLKLTEEHQGYHIYTESKKLVMSWTDCDDDPCSFAIYN